MRKLCPSAIFITALVSFVLSACQPALIQPAASATPDPCTGWECTMSGTVFDGVAEDSKRMVGFPVNLEQVSNCSLTRGEHTVFTDPDGTFSFSVFVHDTDSFVITVDLEGFEPLEKKFGGFDCLYCHCPPLDLVLSSE